MISIDCPASITDITERDHGIKLREILKEKVTKTPEQEGKEYETCPKCGADTEFDYCSDCGWQRYATSSNWYSRRLSR